MNRSIKMLALTLRGVAVELGHLEVRASDRPGFTIRGLRAYAEREMRVRVRAALQTVGAEVGPERGIVIDLPVNAEGAGLDLPVAIAILAHMGRIPEEGLDQVAILGELGLTGSIRPCRGVLPALRGAAAKGIRRAIVPRDCGPEASNAPLGVLVADDLAGVIRYLGDGVELDTGAVVAQGAPFDPKGPDLSDVRGHDAAKRALEIAAAGGHGLLMKGPPGAGKTMLARRLTTILPAMQREEALAVSEVHSVGGLLPLDRGMVSARPFRAPHYSVSTSGLVGGGDPVRPGEVSLAQGGVLMLDELTEFRRETLRSLGSALAEGRARLCRAGVTTEYPARPLTVGAVLPCPCGYAGDRHAKCVCSADRLARWRERVTEITAPLPFDLRICLPPVDVQALQGERRGPSSAEVRKRVVAARKRQDARGTLNASLAGAALEEHCGRQLDRHAAEALAKELEGIADLREVRARILRVARTIADLEGSDVIRASHVMEAVGATKAE